MFFIEKKSHRKKTFFFPSLMRTYLEDNNLLSENQFGFRSKHSTTDQLILCYNNITREVDQGKMTDMIFFGFSKAFDKVCHLLI